MNFNSLDINELDVVQLNNGRIGTVLEVFIERPPGTEPAVMVEYDEKIDGEDDTPIVPIKFVEKIIWKFKND